MDTIYWVIGSAYLAMCIGVAVEADERRHNGIGVLLFCLAFSPLIGAIMYSHYKEKEDAGVEKKE